MEGGFGGGGGLGWGGPPGRLRGRAGGAAADGGLVHQQAGARRRQPRGPPGGADVRHDPPTAAPPAKAAQRARAGHLRRRPDQRPLARGRGQPAPAGRPRCPSWPPSPAPPRGRRRRSTCLRLPAGHRCPPRAPPRARTSPLGAVLVDVNARPIFTDRVLREIELPLSIEAKKSDIRTFAQTARQFLTTRSASTSATSWSSPRPSGRWSPRTSRSPAA